MEQLREETRQKYCEWWSHKNEEPVLILTAWDGSPGPIWPEDPKVRWLDFPSRLDREIYLLEHTLHLGDAVPCLFSNFGPGVLGACMGGKYQYDYHTFWFTEPVLERLEDIEVFRIREDNDWWRMVLEYTEMALERTQGRFLVSVTDIGGGMDVLAGLRGTQRLLVDLIEQPDQVMKALEVVYEEWWKLYQRLSSRILEVQGAQVAWNHIYADGPSYVFQNDFSCMISPDHFKQFDVPFLDKLCKRIPYGMYHLDGPDAVIHAEALINIPDLRAIQWIPGSGAPGGDWPTHGGMLYWEELLMKILNGGKSLEIYINPREVIHLIDRLPKRGLLLKAPCGNREEAERLLEEVAVHAQRHE